MNGFTQFGWALIVAAAVGGPHRLAADNGDVALGVPVEGIEIDGDLSDWPAHMRRYEITQDPTGSPPSDAADFYHYYYYFTGLGSHTKTNSWLALLRGDATPETAVDHD